MGRPAGDTHRVSPPNTLTLWRRRQDQPQKGQSNQPHLQAGREVPQDLGKGGDEEEKPFHYELQHYVDPRQHLVVTERAIERGRGGGLETCSVLF